MNTVSILSSIAVIHLLAIASPGPTFMVVASHAVAGDRRAGLLVTLGVLIATVVWSMLTAAGLLGVVTQLGWLYLGLKLAGAAYLAWMGVKLLRSAMNRLPAMAEADLPTASGLRAVRAGFITNISNPKVVAYYASLFGVMIPHDAPAGVFVGAALTAIVVSAVWWVAVTLFFGLPGIRRAYGLARRWMDGLMGGILIALAARLAISR